MAKRLVDTSSSDKLALESDFQECVKLNSNTEQDISSDIQVNGWLKVGNLSVVGGSSSSQGYAFYEVEPKTVEGYKVFNLNDHTINTFTLSDSTPVKVVLPNATDSNSRDLIIKVNVTSETIPHFEIIPPNDATSMGIESVDDSWAELELGINYFTITETVRG